MDEELDAMVISVRADTQGFAAPGEPFELAITGGTGRYDKARGQVFGENTSPTEMRIKVVLR